MKIFKRVRMFLLPSWFFFSENAENKRMEVSNNFKASIDFVVIYLFLMKYHRLGKLGF